MQIEAIMDLNMPDTEIELDVEDLDEDESEDELLEPGCRKCKPPRRPATGHYQQQLSANFLLPYSDKLEIESAAWLLEIKEGLAKSVMKGDYRPGLIIWTTRLEQYLRLFGRKFTKKDHILMIQLYFELVTDENMEVSLVSRMCLVLSDLLRKVELLSPDDMQLSWRKLYLTYQRLQYNRDEWHGLCSVPDNLQKNLALVVDACRCHFDQGATQEMLDTWRPLLCPHAPSMKKAIRYFSLFLPTIMLPGQETWLLWFEEFMGIWQSFASVTSWENDLIALFSRLALDNIGSVNWTPYISFIFTKFLRNLRLPVGKKRVKLVGENRSFDSVSAAIWPVAMLHQDECLLALEDLFKAVEAYFYPSNYGDWTTKLSGMLMKLPQCVVSRLNMERFKRPSWVPAVPVEAHLTDMQVRRFVKAMKPILLLNMYSKNLGLRLETLLALKSLAELAPDLIVPDLLDRLYPALDSLIEPHRLTASMSAMTICLRSLFGIEQGKSHVLPLMMAVLPGIDSNDYKKSACTFSFLTCLVSMVPLEDCSSFSDREDLTDEQRELCLASSGFEEFALQCFERCLMYITNSTNDHGRHDSGSREIGERMTHEEKFMRLGMSSLVGTIIYQSSDQICQSVLQRLFNFVSNRHLSYNHYTGATVASFCAVAMKLRPSVAQGEIFEPILKLLKNRVSLAADELVNNEELDEEIAWTVKLTAESLSSSGRAILGLYKVSLIQCLHTLLSASCSGLYKLAVVLFNSCLRGLLITFPCNIKSVTSEELGIPPDEFVSVRYWCQNIHQRDLQIKWHIPDEDEIDFAQELIREFLEPALEKLKSHGDGTQPLERKELEKTLLLVEMFVSGAAILFPFDSDPAHQMLPCETTVKIYSDLPDPLISLSARELYIADQPARQYLFDVIQPVLQKISVADEDDVKSIKIILKIFRSLMFYRGLENEELQTRIKAHIVTWKQLSRMLGHRHHQLRLLMFERVNIQHLRRHYDHRGSPLTTLRSAILIEMIKLATGPYKDIRILGQNYFQDGMSNIRFAYRAFVDQILGILEASQGQSNRTAQMKGSLFLILGGRAGSLVLKHDWHTLSKCFPALVKVTSDSKTVASIFDRLAEKMDRHFSTTIIYIRRSDAAALVGQKLLVDLPNFIDPVSCDEMLILNAVWNQRAGESTDNEKLYSHLARKLLDFVRERFSKPKNFHFALFVLSFLIRRDVQLLPNMVETFLENWANPSSEKARKLSQHPMLSVLRWLKRPIIRTSLHALDQNNPKDTCGLPTAGIRTDNLWLCFNESKLPRNEHDYESTIFVDKVQHGYYGWPLSLEVAAPVKDQISLGKMPESLNSLEMIFYEKMTNESYIAILIRLLSVEDSKLHAKFDPYTFWIFRTMFRHFEDAFLAVFIPHLSKLVTSKEEHHHRCAAEIMAGIVRGSKRWPYTKLLHLVEVLTPLLKTALSNLSTESLPDWGEFAHYAFNEGDARRNYSLLKLFFDMPKSETSFQSSSRLYVLQSCFFVAFDWRRKELHDRILDLMKEQIEERYRDRVAWTLANLFRNEIQLPNTNLVIEQTPRLITFLTEYYATCKDTLLPSNYPNNMVAQMEKNTAVLKTVVKMVAQTVILSMGYAPSQIQWFLPLLLRFESDTRDEELRQDCFTALACLSQIALSFNEIEEMLMQVEDVVYNSSGNVPWRDRVLALQHLQTVVFNNFFTIKNNAEWVDRIQKLAIQNLNNESLEVRETASVTLAGLVQCGFLSLEKGFLDQFFRKSITSYQTGEEKSSKALLMRHAGILGLCAYISAYPYSVAVHTPDILIILSGHINDPQPINQTVKNTIKEFRRTHLDNWSEHRSKFTEEQLIVLTDLLVSPTYYA